MATAPLQITPLERDAWPFALPTELGGVNDRPAGIDATARDGRRVLVTVDTQTQTLTCAVAQGTKVSGIYVIAAQDLASAFLRASGLGTVGSVGTR